MSTPESTARLSPTAHATGYLWYRHGLSDAALVTPQGKRLDRGFRALTGLTQKVSGMIPKEVPEGSDHLTYMAHAAAARIAAPQWSKEDMFVV